MKINFFNIKEQNPHFEEGYTYKTYKRRLEEKIINYIEDRRIIAILGLRRIGKTHILRSIINILINNNIPRQNIMYFSFDKFSTYKGDAIKDAINQFLGEFHSTNIELVDKNTKFHFFLDEVQKVPYFNSNIKIIYDFHPNFKFIISGSSSYNIREDQNETLAGRVVDIEMTPLDWQEYLELKAGIQYPKINFIAELIKTNQINTNHTIFQRPKQLLIEFLEKKDIIESIFIDDPKYVDESIIPKIFDRELIVAATGRENQNFFRMAPTLFNYSGKIVNLTNLSTEEQISKYQISKAIELGEKLFFWKTLSGKQKDKIYSSSSSIAYSIQKSKNSNLDLDGLLFESKVFFKVKEFANNIIYFKDEIQEIDFIVDNYIGIECKLGDLGNLKPIINAAKKNKLKMLIIVGQDYIKYDKQDDLIIWIIPWWMV